MKYFVISDIHSHYNEMISCLNKAGYDSENPNQHLIVLGDLFDRGKQPKEVLEYLYTLNKAQKATIILGNHDTFLMELLEENYDRALFNMAYNGFDKTLYYLTDILPVKENLPLVRDKIMNNYPYLYDWLSSFPLYLEVGDYIFVHGGIDGGMLDWKEMQTKRDYIWGREINYPRVEGKTVVAGHHRTAQIRKRTDDYHRLFLHDPSQFDILRKEGKILIDRFVEVSNEINVLILDI